MQELNWNLFRTKFNGKETKAFEYLCYLLFCREFGGSNIGIFRFKNQPGIETEPILVNGKWIGFQSKFFDKAIDRKDLENSIETTKKHYPNVTTIYVYVNLEFSKNQKGKDPKLKTEIEEFANSKSVEIEWRVPSHIEAQLALAQNKTLADYFFSRKTGALDAIEGLIEHTSSILKPISSQIEFNGKIIKIDTAQLLASLISTLSASAVVVVSGVAGVGKTALIKDFYFARDPKTPLYVFKATEFNVDHVNDLFHKYGDLSIVEFVNEHEALGKKYVVVDSAEKLADLRNQDAFQEFLSTLLRHDWRIIFTTRYAYLDDLKFQFVDVYGLKFEPFVIKNLTSEQLEALSNLYKFSLPTSSRFFELLKNPFYLGQYLKAIGEAGSSRMELTLQGFKTQLWERQIAKTSYRVNNVHLKRERCFINLARTRADSGGFFITEVAGCDENALKALEEDEIVERETNSGRFFISHDIYEEWALERLIEASFQSASDFNALFEELGNSLPIRRAFRTWLSEQLVSDRYRVKSIIQASFTNENIAPHWKDEVLISVLLSDYAESFFQMFESELLANQQKLLLRTIFLLRIACKEIDESLLKLLGVTKRSVSILSTVLTKPKGSGWSCAIKFLYNQRESISDSNAETILPLLEEWTNKVQIGEATRCAGLLAIDYYERWYRNEQLRYSKLRPNKDRLIGIISNASGEIKGELAKIFDEIISKREVGHQTEHYELVKRALSSATESYAIARNLPEQVLKLADLVWHDDPKRKRNRYEQHSTMVEVESRFCILVSGIDYFPASAFQTPIFQLLQCAAKPTLDFILSFTNKTAECYAKSDFATEVEEAEVKIDGEATVKQYISARLWHAYRGTHVSTHLLESIHMALERWLIEQAKTASQSEAEELCEYLIRNSRSASITAIIVSVVLSQPLKLFNVARILFRTKEFFYYDTARLTGDLSSSRFTFGTGLNYRHEIFEKERIKASKDLHRRLSLEQLALNYQLYKFEGESDESAQDRQRVIGQILDEHYAKLGIGADESESEKTWRLYLARMDRRKMDAEVKQQDGQTVVQFSPQIDPELKQFSEDSLKISSEVMKYSSLYLWSHARFKKETEQYKQYGQYEEDHHKAILECTSLRDEVSNPVREARSALFNASIPAYTCAVLIRDFYDKLSDEEKAFSKEVLLQFVSTALAAKGYYVHTLEGSEPAILSLPLLLKHFPDDRDRIKSLMFLLLIYRSPSDASRFTAQAILKDLWRSSFDDAQSFFLGYLLLKPEYEKLLNKSREQYYQDFSFGEFSDESVLKEFLDTHGTELETVIANNVKLDQLPDLSSIDLDVLNVAFQFLPPGTTDRTHQKFLRAAFEVFAERIFDDGEDKIDYSLKRAILEKIAAIVLSSSPAETVSYIKPFLETFRASRDTAEFFAQFLWAQDALQAYEQFWLVWNAFYPKIVDLSNGPSRYDTQSIIHNYLFAWNYWNQNAKEWHTLKERERMFFQRVAKDMGHHPAVLYSLAKVLNEVGSGFIDDGLLWLCDVLQSNRELETAELEKNTIYYLESVIRKYALLKRSTIQSSVHIKSRVLTVLNFLIEKGSAIGYLLREDIL